MDHTLAFCALTLILSPNKIAMNYYHLKLINCKFKKRMQHFDKTIIVTGSQQNYKEIRKSHKNIYTKPYAMLLNYRANVCWSNNFKKLSRITFNFLSVNKRGKFHILLTYMAA